MRTILIVEDDLHTNQMLCTLVRSLGYQAVAAFNATEGIELAHELLPDLILMDVRMPGIDGWQATNYIKSNTELQHIPVIIVMAPTSLEDRKIAAASGCDEFIPKPFKYNDLVGAIKHYLQPASVS